MTAIATTTTAPARAEFKDAARVNNGVLARAEKQALIWIAHRLPRWVNSDHLTALALVGMLGAGLSYWLASAAPAALCAAVLCLAINWFGDSLDGTLARVRGHQRPRYGHYVDHVLDVVGAACLLGGLGLSGYMSGAVAAILLVAYLLLTAEVFLATHSMGTFTMSYFKVGPTELRIVLAIGSLTLLVHPSATLLGHSFLLFDVGGVIATAGLLGTFALSVARHTRALYLAEPLPRDPERR